MGDWSWRFGLNVKSAGPSLSQLAYSGLNSPGERFDDTIVLLTRSVVL